MTATQMVGLTLVGVLVTVPAAAQGGFAGDTEGQTIEVRMVDRGPSEFVFEPAEITVRPGDRVVWVQTGVMPHNVEFTAAPESSDVPGLPRSPFLTTRDQRYELVIDDRFGTGQYEYICTPHVTMGMSGTIKVVPAETR